MLGIFFTSRPINFQVTTDIQ